MFQKNCTTLEVSEALWSPCPHSSRGWCETLIRRQIYSKLLQNQNQTISLSLVNEQQTSPVLLRQKDYQWKSNNITLNLQQLHSTSPTTQLSIINNSTLNLQQLNSRSPTTQLHISNNITLNVQQSSQHPKLHRRGENIVLLLATITCQFQFKSNL